MTARSDIDRWVIGLAYAAGAPDPLATADRVDARLKPTTYDDATIRAVMAAIDVDTQAAREWQAVNDRAMQPPWARDPDGRLAGAVRAGQAAVEPLPTPAEHNAGMTAPARHDPDTWARVYDAVNDPLDRMRSPYGRALAALDAAYPDGSRDTAPHLRNALETARDLDDAQDLLDEIRQAIDTHAAGRWLGEDLWARIQGATRSANPTVSGHPVNSRTGSDDT